MRRDTWPDQIILAIRRAPTSGAAVSARHTIARNCKTAFPAVPRPANRASATFCYFVGLQRICNAERLSSSSATRVASLASTEKDAIFIASGHHLCAKFSGGDVNAGAFPWGSDADCGETSLSSIHSAPSRRARS